MKYNIIIRYKDGTMKDWRHVLDGYFSADSFVIVKEDYHSRIHINKEIIDEVTIDAIN